MNIMDEDVLRIRVNRRATGYVRECYADFGWEAVKEKTSRFTKSLCVWYRRPHFIPNKDELQLLQVRLESALNNTGKILVDKHKRAFWYGVLFAVAAILFFTEAGLMFAFYRGATAIALGCVSVLFGFLSLFVGRLFSRRIYLEDCKESKRLLAEQFKIMRELRARALELREVKK